MSNPLSKCGTRSQRIYSTGHGKLVFGNRCLVMGILNVTPDSFSDGGRHLAEDAAIRRAVDMVREGADVIDIGGESTRPGSLPVSAGEQIDRVVPVISGARTAGVTVPISIDTQSAEVAAEALNAGADIVNDVSGMRLWTGSVQTDSGADYIDHVEMMRLLADRGVPYIVVHMTGTPATMQLNPAYNDVVQAVGRFFAERAERLSAAGVKTNGRMIVDPGIGFGKTLEHNISLVQSCAGYSTDWPVLLGTSRKRFIGEILATASADGEPPDAEHRIMGTAATVAYAALAGVDMVRVHDVRAMRDVVEVCLRLL
ncbi:MAG: dihydropteroate synthase [Phycisphaerales bacterium]|nr:dihydropteroate synthase [Phycisphaerales bacterium]MCB9854186.1 dihydropteroate synthase [Phycisphaerales bacterium]